MQVDDLAGLCVHLQEKVRHSQFQIVMQKLFKTFQRVLEDTHWYAPYKKINKDSERLVKQMLYRIETLFREIEESMEESRPPEVVEYEIYSKAIGKLLTGSEMKLIMKKLKIFSENEGLLITTKESMVGREFHDRKEQLIALLLDPKSDSRIVILGKHGTGKSFLTCQAVQDSRVQKYFDTIDTREQTIGTEGKYNNFWDHSKQRLAVVDDWPVDKIKSFLSEDEQVLKIKLFKYYGKGSKIVIISSFDLHRELEHIGASAISLPSLDKDESWDLVQKIAFSDQARSQHNMLAIGRKICQKCDKIPGVLEIAASILSSKSTTEEWEHFLNVVMTSVPDPVTTIYSFSVFIQSLRDDKRYWRHCFAWCSLLPKDYNFRKDHLFHLWRAQEDFLRDADQDRKLTYEQFDDCFNEFLSKGYFLIGETIDSIVRYKINYLVFELMKFVAGDDFCLVDKITPEPNLNIIRHASFIVDPSWEPPSWLSQAKQLQSLLLWPQNFGDCKSLSIIELSFRTTDIRALYAEAVRCQRLPIFLFKSDKLSYLTLGAFSTISLPKDIPVVHELLDSFLGNYNSTENLLLYGGDILVDGNRKAERHALLVQFTGLKKLTMQYKKCYEINSFEQTDKVIASFIIQTLSSKRNGRELEYFGPHQTLESLEVRQWKGEMLPTWAIDEHSVFLSSLLSIRIANCSGFHVLPSFSTLPQLSSLELGSLCSLVDITISGENSKASSENPFYPSLKCLVLYDLPKLKGWKNQKANNTQDIVEQYCFPLLTEVKIHGCPVLTSIPSVQMLESLEAINIDTKILNQLMRPPLIIPSPTSEDINDLIETSQQHFSLIKTLEFDDCEEFGWGNELTTIEKGVWQAFKCLHSLKLSNNQKLASLPRGLGCITTLEQLSICWLTNLKVLPEWIGQLTHLRQLTILYCPKLIMLPKSDGSFSALVQLEIRYCPRVSQFPESLPKLKRLHVQEFSRLEKILSVSQNLEKLEINNCDELEWETPSVEGEVSVNVWERLNRLRSLKLTKMDTFPKDLDFAKLSKLSQLVIEKCPKLISLPKSLCSLATLEDLRIHYCPGLTNIPDDFKNLGSLKKLEIRVSPQLEKRCKRDGEDWHLIQHISDIVINDSAQQQSLA